MTIGNFDNSKQVSMSPTYLNLDHIASVGVTDLNSCLGGASWWERVISHVDHLLTGSPDLLAEETRGVILDRKLFELETERLRRELRLRQSQR